VDAALPNGIQAGFVVREVNWVDSGLVRLPMAIDRLHPAENHDACVWVRATPSSNVCQPSCISQRHFECRT